MTDLTTRTDCPADAVLAAWIDGVLGPSEAQSVREHLTYCERCLEMVSETAELLEEEDLEEAPSDGSRSVHSRPNLVRTPAPGILLAVAAALLVAIVAGVLLLRPSSTTAHSPTARLASLAPEQRPIEPRLAGFEYAPVAPITRGDREGTRPDWRLVAEAAKIEEEASASPTPENLHALGVAHLLLSNRDEAVATLRRARDEAIDPSPALRSDLAAALIELGTYSDDPSLLSEAIDEIEAIPASARTPELLFNLALALDELGLKPQALEAWNDYIELDGASNWSIEARERVRRIEEDLDLRTKTPTSARLEVQVLEQYLGGWADAVVAGDEGRAAALHDAAVAAANRHNRMYPDPLLIEIVRSIDESPHRGTNASGLRLYRASRAAYEERRFGHCLTLAAKAAGTFSPSQPYLAGLSRLTEASCSFMLNDLDATTRALEAARRTGGQSGILGGQLAWMEGLVAIVRHDIFVSLERYLEARELLGSSLDHARTSDVDHLLSEVYSRTGSGPQAMRYARDAVARHAGHDGRLYMKVVEMSSIASANDQGRAALRFLEYAEELARRQDSSTLLANALFRRADVYERTGQFEAAMTTLERSLATTRNDRNTGTRIRATAQSRAALAMLLSKHDPPRAVAVADEAIALAGDAGHEMTAVHARLAKVSALAAVGRTDEAERLLQYVTNEIFEQSSASTNLTVRDDYLALRRSVLERHVGLLIEQDRYADALALVNSYRAGGEAGRVASVPDERSVLAYVVLPDQLLIWHLRASGVALHRRDISSEELRRLIQQTIEESRLGSGDAATGRLARLLFPAGWEIASTVVILPDSLLSGLPFRYLLTRVERFGNSPTRMAVVNSLSSARIHDPVLVRAGSCLLTVKGATSGGRLYPDLRKLRHVASELDTLSSGYRCARRASSPEEMSDLLGSDTGVIHIAGHAIAGRDESALLFDSDDGSIVALGTREIERLPLDGAIVVLTSCSTADGRASTTRGRDGIAQAFLAAGARAVVGNLWEIEDEAAAAFAESLHRRLRSGEDLESSFEHALVHVSENFPTTSVSVGWTLYKG